MRYDYSVIRFNLQTLSHEVGHNLGMEHDFYTSKSACKLDEDGKFVWCNKCTNWDKQLKKVNIDFGRPGDCCTGFMDYGDHPEYWSNCSVRNFEQHYISQNWAKCMPKGIFLYIYMDNSDLFFNTELSIQHLTT